MDLFSISLFFLMCCLALAYGCIRENGFAFLLGSIALIGLAVAVITTGVQLHEHVISQTETIIDANTTQIDFDYEYVIANTDSSEDIGWWAFSRMLLVFGIMGIAVSLFGFLPGTGEEREWNKLG